MRNILFLFFSITIGVFAQTTSDIFNTGSTSGIDRLNQISVSIGGAFLINGSFPALATERVDQFITRIYEKARSEIVQSRNVSASREFREINKKIDNWSKRDILLKRPDGSEIKIDLEKFRLTGDLSLNPYLRNDDILIFPVYDPDRNFIEINGAVNKPIKFQFVEGDKLSDALIFAYGINPAYENVKQARISRLSYDGNEEEIIFTDIDDDLNLKRGDRITVIAAETQRKSYNVLVVGEVNLPGLIPITKNSATLREVIEKAGGFKSTASLENAEIIRNLTPADLLRKESLFESNNPYIVSPEFNAYEYYLKNLELPLIKRQSNLTIEDTMFFNFDNQIRLMERKNIVDFTKVMEAGSEEGSFIVRDGDAILIPEKNNYIYVFGQVPKAGYIKYEQGKDYMYYIEKAGGLGDLARSKDEITLIKGKTKEWIYIDKKDALIEPGDFIYVPKDEPKTFGFYLDRVSSITGIVGGVATIILLIVQLGK